MMRALLRFALLSCLVTSSLACAGRAPSDDLGEGDGEGEGEGEGEVDVVDTELHHYVGVSDGTEARLVIETRSDGTRLVRSEMRATLALPDIDVEDTYVAVEEALIGPNGLESSTHAFEVVVGATRIVRRWSVDAVAGTAVAARPGAEVQVAYDVDGGEHWLPFMGVSSAVRQTAVASPLACLLIHDAAAAGATTFALDPHNNFTQTVPPLAEGPVTSGRIALVPGDIFCSYDERGAVSGVQQLSWEMALLDDGDDGASAIATVAAPAPAPIIQPTTCDGPLRSESFTLDSRGVSLAGEIDLPAGDGPFPVVVTNAGTGGAPRDGYAGVPVFRCLALALVADGIAVARYDDPGYGESTGSTFDATFEDRDAHTAAVAALVAARDDVREDGLFLLGHSEGSTHSSRAAALLAPGVVDGVVHVAGVSSVGGDVFVGQLRALLENAGYGDDAIDVAVQPRVDFVDAIHDGSPAQLGPFSREFWEGFVFFDGAASAVDAGVPALIVQGTGDWQVPPENADGFVTALEAAGIDVELVVLEDVGHSMVAAHPDFAGIGEEYGVPVAWSPVAVNAIISWVHARAP